MIRNKKLFTVAITLSVLIFLVGLVAYLYPIIMIDRSQKEIEATIERFIQITAVQTLDMTAELQTSGGETAEETPEEEYIRPYAELWEKMDEYNRTIYEEGQQNLKDPFSYEQASFDLTEYGFLENIIGYIDIPKMEVTLPIYLGASKANMKLGAVHMSQTSLPIGGENTNSVIPAHRGTTYNGPMFQEIQLLEIGDLVYLTNLWETMTYEVVEITPIEANDVKKVLIREGQDMITLLSCDPYPQAYRRIAVFCERVDDINDK